MKIDYAEIVNFRKKLDELNGVATIKDLANLFSKRDPVVLNNLVTRLIKFKLLSRFYRGIYISGNYSDQILAQKIYPESYISLTTVLSKELIIGAIPQKTVYAVKIGKTKEITNNNLRIKYFGITRDMFFGYEAKNGVLFATKEKAFLDLLYFYQKGFKPSINIYSDLNISILDKKLINKYLKNYKNKKFIVFVQNLINNYEY